MTASAWLHFTVEELSCQCGCGAGPEMMDHRFMQSMVALREECGFPFPVTSAYRCPAHNAAVSKTGTTGPHTTGKAIDIGVDRQRARILLSKADSKRFPGLGVNQRGSARFIHLDALTERTWSY